MIVYTIRQQFIGEKSIIKKYLSIDHQYSNVITDAILFPSKQSAKSYIKQLCNEFPSDFQDDFIIQQYFIKFIREVK